MKVWMYFKVDGDSGYYDIQLFETESMVESFKEKQNNERSRVESFEVKMAAPIESVKCPICDSEMKSRTGKFGVFWGCTKYPNCKGTRDNMGRSKDEREKVMSDDRDREIDEQNGPSRYPFRKGR